MIFTDEITPTIAHHVLWQYGNTDEKHGYEPGSFVSALLKAITRADDQNRSRLRLAFPGYVDACDLIERNAGGADVLRRIIESRQP